MTPRALLAGLTLAALCPAIPARLNLLAAAIAEEDALIAELARAWSGDKLTREQADALEGVWQVQEEGLRVLQGHEVDAALAADAGSGELHALFARLMETGAAWLNETYAILHVDPRTGMMFGYRYRDDPNPEFDAANSTFAANQVKRLVGVAETARAVGPGARVLVLRFTESDDTSYTEAHVFPDPGGEPGDLLMLVNRLEGLEVRDKEGKVIDNQVVKVFKARKTDESVRDAVAELRPQLPVTVPVQA